MSEIRLFVSVVRALVFNRGDPAWIPSEGTGNFSAMLYFATAIYIDWFTQNYKEQSDSKLPESGLCAHIIPNSPTAMSPRMNSSENITATGLGCFVANHNKWGD